ncbi:hypothetical protein [Mycolicibacterium sp. HS_4_1]
MTPMKPPRWGVYRYRRVLAIFSIATLLLAALITTTRDDHGSTIAALPGATAQPSVPGGGSGGSGGSGGGPPFPLQPPGMPDGPSAYNSGSYPAPDQGNGISIYNSGAPQSSGSQGYEHAPNDPQQLQPANGQQPPDYDAPLQTAAAQPSVAQQAPMSQAPAQQSNQAPQSQQGNQGQSGTNSTTNGGQNSGSNQGSSQSPAQNGNSNSPQTQNLSREQVQQQQESLDKQSESLSRQQEQLDKQYDQLDQDQQALEQNQQLSQQERADQQAQLDQREYELDSKQSDLDEQQQQLEQQKQQFDQENQENQEDPNQQQKKNECDPNSFLLPKTATLQGDEKAMYDKFKRKARKQAVRIFKREKGIKNIPEGWTVDHALPLRRLWDKFKEYGITDEKTKLRLVNMVANLKLLEGPWNFSKGDDDVAGWNYSDMLDPQPTPKDLQDTCALTNRWPPKLWRKPSPNGRPTRHLKFRSRRVSTHLRCRHRPRQLLRHRLPRLLRRLHR